MHGMIVSIIIKDCTYVGKLRFKKITNIKKDGKNITQF